MGCQIIRNKETGAIEQVKAPNGKLSRLFRTLLEQNSGNAEQALRQYAMVYTPSFIQWFGDWQNDPQNASKVVDVNGEPLVVYHWSKNEFEAFDKSKKGSNTGFSDTQAGFFFTEDKGYKEYASRGDESVFGNIEYPVFLSIKSPAVDFTWADADDVERVNRLYNFTQNPTAHNRSLLSRLTNFSKEAFKYDGLMLSNTVYSRMITLRTKMQNWTFEVENDPTVRDEQQMYRKELGRGKVRPKPGKEEASHLYNYIVAFEPNQIKSIFNQGTFDVNNDNISYMPAVVDTTAELPEGGLTKLIHLKKNLLSNAKQRLAQVRSQLKQSKSDASLTDSLSKEETRLKVYIEGRVDRNDPSKTVEGLEQEILRLQSVDSKEPEIIRPFIEKELDRLDTLVTGNAKDVSEAQEIIRFIKALADLRLTGEDANRYGHPLFERDELFNDTGEFALSEGIEAKYREWYDRANVADSALLQRSRELFTEVVANNDAVERMYGEGMTYDQIVKTGKGMKDANWWDMMLMDIGTGIFSKNGIIPQVAQIIINEEFEKQAAWSKKANEDIDAALPEAKKVLESLGYNINIPGIKNVSYDLFRQKDKYGNLKPNIAAKYSYEYTSDLTDTLRRFSDLRQKAIDAEENQDAAFTRAYDFKRKWFKDNTMLANPALMAEIASDPEFVGMDDFGTPEEQAAHRQELVNLVGEQHYQKIVAEVKEKLKGYRVQRQHVVDNLLAEQGVDDEIKLDDSGKFSIKVYEMEANPFNGAIYSKTDKPLMIGQKVKIHNSYEFNVHVPLKDKGYYDNNYETIEKHPALIKLYDAFYRVTSESRQRLDYEAQRFMTDTSIAGVEKSMLEMFLDKDMGARQKLSKAFRQIIDRMKNSLGVNKQDSLSYAKINSISGVPEYQINDSFLQQNKEKIRSIFNVRAILFTQEFNKFAQSKLERPTRYTVVKVTNSNRVSIARALAKYTNTPEDQIVARYGKEVVDGDGSVYTSLPVGKIIWNQAVHETAQEQSFDLPKVMKLYANNVAQYSARRATLPTMELMKSHYEGISKQATNNVDEAINNSQDNNNNRLNVLRTNAVKQYDNWFDRVVLGNYGLRKNYGFINSRDEKLPEVKTKTQRLLRMINAERFDGKLYNESERKLVAQINEAILKYKEELDGLDQSDKDFKKNLARIESQLNYLNDRKDKIGKDFALSGVFDTLMNFVRWRGLGFNLPSGVKNVVEGQIANSITASRGLYFPPEALNELTLSEMVAADSIAKGSSKKMPKNAAKIKVLMEQYDVLQDASNELQKSSAQSRFKALSRFNPFYLLKKGEYYNQAPLLAALLKHTEIKSISGEAYNVKDALEAYYDDSSKKWKVKLKDEFRTEENIQSWEQANGKDYFNFKTRMRTVLKDTHGDFDPLSGMMAKSTHMGQALLMFKTWLPREIYKRFGTEQDDLRTGVQGQKGFYRSHTPTSAFFQGAIIGSMAFGPVGGLITGTAGAIWGKLYGTKSNLNVLEETMLITKLLFRKAIGIPLNPIARVLGNNRNSLTATDRQKEFQRMESRTFTQQDYNNFKANMQDMAMMFGWFACLLLTKAFLWDDDDTEEDTRRKAHNLLANEFMGLSSQAAGYASPTGLQETITNMGVIRFLTDAGKTIGKLKGLTEGTDIITSGPNRGESAFFSQAQKTLLPGIAHTQVGFGKLEERQFVKSPYDNYFYGPEKEAKLEIKMHKATFELQLREQFPELNDDQFKKVLNKQFGKKRKNETYVQFLERIEQREEQDD